MYNSHPWCSKLMSSDGSRKDHCSGKHQTALQEKLTNVTPSAWERQMCIMMAYKPIRKVNIKGGIDLLA